MALVRPSQDRTIRGVLQVSSSVWYFSDRYICLMGFRRTCIDCRLWDRFTIIFSSLRLPSPANSHFWVGKLSDGKHDDNKNNNDFQFLPVLEVNINPKPLALHRRPLSNDSWDRKQMKFAPPLPSLWVFVRIALFFFFLVFNAIFLYVLPPGYHTYIPHPWRPRFPSRRTPFSWPWALGDIRTLSLLLARRLPWECPCNVASARRAASIYSLVEGGGHWCFELCKPK